MLSPHVPSSLSFAAQPPASLRASHRRLLVDQKHLFPFGRRSQIPGSLCPFGPFLRRARASHSRLLVDQKHLFPFGRRSQIPGSPEPSGLFLHPAHSSVRRSVDRKHPFPGRLQIPGSLDFFDLFLHRAHSQLRAHSSRRAPSLLRAASRASPQASPRSPRAVLQSRASFQPPASSLMVIAVRLAVAPTRRQPAPVNSLSVN